MTIFDGKLEYPLPLYSNCIHYAVHVSVLDDQQCDLQCRSHGVTEMAQYLHVISQLLNALHMPFTYFNVNYRESMAIP